MAICSLSLNVISSKIIKEVTSSRLSAPLAIGKDLYALPYSFDKEDMKEDTHRGSIVFSLKSNEPFITLTNEKFTKVAENTPFFNALKKISFCKVEKIEKIQGERTIVFTLKTDNNCFDTLTLGYKLVLDIMPYRPNCLLLSLDNKIISIFHEKIDIEKDIYLSRNATYYIPQNRSFPTSNNLEDYKSFISKATYRHTENYLNDHQDIKVSTFLKSLYDSKKIYLDKEDIIPSSFDDKNIKEIQIEDIYNIFVIDQKKQAKIEKEKELISTIEKALKLAIKKKSKLELDYKKNENYVDYMNYGQMILLYQTELKKGDSKLEKDGYSIPLDVKLTPVENANKYFKKYNKAKAATSILKDLLLKTDNEIEYLKKKEMEARNGTPRDIVELKSELVYLNYLKNKGKQYNSILKKKKCDPHYLKTPYCKIGYGNNGFQNEELTFSIAKKDDTFLHLLNYPSSHVVILDYSDYEKALLLGCELVLYLSHIDNGDIMVAKKKDVKKNPSKLGLVNILKYETIHLNHIRKESLDLFKEMN